MRANDAYIGFLSDVFHFTFLQEYIARRLAVRVDRYYHHVGSIHIYEPDLDRARALANEPVGEAPPSYPIMPFTTPQMIAEVLEAEGAIRSRALALEDVLCLALPDYWLNVLVLFWLHAHKPRVLRPGARWRRFIRCIGISSTNDGWR